MKVIGMIARYLLGVIFAFFGANHLFSFLPKPAAMPTGPAGEFISAMTASGYFYVVGACEVVPGLLLLIGRFVPLGLVVLGAVIVNIDLTAILFSRMALPMSAFVTVLWLLVFYQNRAAFAPLFKARAEG